jgi:hypothetical protein
MGNPYMVKGNQLARLKGKRQRNMLEKLTPKVMEILEQGLASDDFKRQWVVCKELIPYLFARKAPIQTDAPSTGDDLDVTQYLKQRTIYGLTKQKPAS